MTRNEKERQLCEEFAPQPGGTNDEKVMTKTLSQLYAPVLMTEGKGRKRKDIRADGGEL